MSSRRQILKGGATLGAGQVVSQGCSFVRNIIIARLISPRDFGIAATFAVTISVFDLMSNLNMDKLLIQAEDGGERAFQNTAQLLQVAKGVMNAAFIFVLGRYIAGLFGEPQARWAFELLALVPLLCGLIHLDTYRFQRDMRFRPAVTVDVVSQILVTLAALPLAFWLRDYKAMLCVLILQAAIATTVSHLVAERKYGWTWEKSYAHRIVRFGWPLLINGLLLFIILDGDRFIIGSAHKLFAKSTLTLADLGVYSVAFALTMAPTMLIANVSTSLLLPHLSRVQEARAEFEKRYSLFAQGISLVAAMVSIQFILAGGWVVTLIYGQKYASATGFIGWLAAMWALRMVRVTPTLAAMSLGDTKNAMASNIARTAALIGVLVSAATGKSVAWIAFSGFIGELLALGVCVGRLRREHGVRAILAVKPFIGCAVGLAAGGALAFTGIEQHGAVMCLATAALLAGGILAAMMLSFPELRSRLSGLAFGLGSGLGHQKVASRPEL